MSALIAGLDISSRRLDAALIPLDPDDGSDAPAVTLRQYLMPTEKQMRGVHEETTPARRSVERCRVVRDAARMLLADVLVPHTWNSRTSFMAYSHEVVHVCVEEPFGGGKQHRPSDNVLREIYGAILASIPPHIERDTITTQEWRRIIWSIVRPKDPQDEGWKYVARVRALQETGVEMDEHQAEATLIAMACRARLERDTKSAA